MIYEEEHPFAIAYRLVEEGKLDPWNVDIAQLANLYIQEIRKMELLDLRVPARALSAAVFLLKTGGSSLSRIQKEEGEKIHPGRNRSNVRRGI